MGKRTREPVPATPGHANLLIGESAPVLVFLANREIGVPGRTYRHQLQSLMVHGLTPPVMRHLETMSKHGMVRKIST